MPTGGGQLGDEIRERAGPLGIQLAPEQLERLAEYCRLVWDWNERLNLTRHTTPELFVTRDLLDAFQLSRHVSPGERLLDIGSGGGVPGVLLAILRPDVAVHLSESTGKKARALEDIVKRMGMELPVFAERAEQVLARTAFDTVVARAVGSMAHVLRLVRPHWAHVGRLLLVKGPRWVDERKEARHFGLLKPLELRRLESYRMPGTNAESVLLVIWPKAESAEEAPERGA